MRIAMLKGAAAAARFPILWIGHKPSWFRFVFGCLLLVAAVLKLASGSTGEGWPFAPPSGVVLANLEYCLGVWLLAGVYPRSAAATALIVSITFACVAGVRLAKGSHDCGCFGNTLAVPPWIILIFDLTMAWGFLSTLVSADFERQVRTAVPRRSRIARAVALCMVVSIGLATNIVVRVGTRSHRPIQEGYSTLVVTDTSQRRGTNWPLLRYISSPYDTLLRKGEWTVLIYDHNCGTCSQIVASRKAVLSRQRNSERRFVFLDIAANGRTMRDSSYDEAVLADTVLWASAVPVTIRLKDGAVVRLWGGSE